MIKKILLTKEEKDFIVENMLVDAAESLANRLDFSFYKASRIVYNMRMKYKYKGIFDTFLLFGQEL